MAVAGVNDTYSNLGLALQSSDKKRTELGQDAFLKLMTAQMQHQDPFKPMESGEFLGQIAQFSTVSGIQAMQESLAGLSTALTSNQTLQAANLVGRGVNAGRLQTVGRGEIEPVASNDSESGMAQNRRVEVAIYASEAYRNQLRSQYRGQ